MSDLEPLEQITCLSLLTCNIHNSIDQFGTLGIVSLGPIISSTTLTKNKVIRSEYTPEWTGTDSIHSARFKIGQDGTGDVSATLTLVEVHIDPLELIIIISLILSGSIDTVFLGHYLTIIILFERGVVCV